MARDLGNIVPHLCLAEPLVPGHFRDREDVVQEAVTALADGRWLLLAGVGGVGKTTAAARIASLLRASHGRTVLWIDVGHNSKLGTLVETFARSVGTSVRAILSTNAKASHLRAVSAEKRLIIVFDDVDSDAILRQLLACVGPGNSVLITARQQGFSSLFQFGVRTLPLGPLSRQDACDLLIELIGQAKPDRCQGETWSKLADALGDLPLAIEVAAGELRFRTSIDDASLAVANQEIRRWFSTDARLNAITNVIATSVDDMGSKYANAFACLGTFEGNNLSREAIGAICDLQSPDMLDEFLAALQKRMFVSVSNESYSIHPEIRQFARNRLASLQQGEGYLQPQRRYVQHYGGIARRYGGYEWALAKYPGMIPHETEVFNAVKIALECGEQEGKDALFYERQAVEMMFHLSWYLHWRGYWDVRKSLCSRLIALLDRPDGLSRHANATTIAGNLYVDIGWIHLWRGNVHEALRCAQRGRELLTNTGDLVFANELEGQAALHSGETSRAKSIFAKLCEQVSEDRRVWFVFSYRLADTLGVLNERAEQKCLIERLLTRIRRLGETPPEFVSDIHGRIALRAAKIARTDGEDARSLELYEEAVARFGRSDIVTEERVEAIGALAEVVWDRDRKIALLKEALEQATQLGMQTEMVHLQKQLLGSAVSQ